jgi:CHAD domain-containing protein
LQTYLARPPCQIGRWTDITARWQVSPIYTALPCRNTLRAGCRRNAAEPVISFTGLQTTITFGAGGARGGPPALLPVQELALANAHPLFAFPAVPPGRIMPRFQKWLTGAQPDAPADEVARLALAERLLAVGYYLEQSLGDADEAESIHQLRVWTRRAAAALALFKPALPRGPRKRLKRTLRKIRRSAGDIRDCDVYLQRLDAEPAGVPDCVVAVLKRDRRVARQEFKRLRRRLCCDDQFPHDVQQLLTRINWPKRHSSRDAIPFGPFCREQLAPLAGEFFDLAHVGLEDDRMLHALRIAGKRLRYALELAPSAMPTDVHRLLYEQLDELQDRLGEVVDQLAALSHLRDWLIVAKRKRDRRLLAELLHREEKRLKELRSRLSRWWSPERRAQLRGLWDQSLAGLPTVPTQRPGNLQ